MTIIYYENGNDNEECVVYEGDDERAARASAAEALGHNSLRGARGWPTTTGQVWQFGRDKDAEINPCCEIVY